MICIVTRKSNNNLKSDLKLAANLSLDIAKKNRHKIILSRLTHKLDHSENDSNKSRNAL